MQISSNLMLQLSANLNKEPSHTISFSLSECKALN